MFIRQVLMYKLSYFKKIVVDDDELYIYNEMRRKPFGSGNIG